MAPLSRARAGSRCLSEALQGKFVGTPTPLAFNNAGIYYFSQQDTAALCSLHFFSATRGTGTTFKVTEKRLPFRAGLLLRARTTSVEAPLEDVSLLCLRPESGHMRSPKPGPGKVSNNHGEEEEEAEADRW